MHRRETQSLVQPPPDQLPHHSGRPQHIRKFQLLGTFVPDPASHLPCLRRGQRALTAALILLPGVTLADGWDRFGSDGSCQVSRGKWHFADMVMGFFGWAGGGCRSG
jgi:hypothetical protein